MSIPMPVFGGRGGIRIALPRYDVCLLAALILAMAPPATAQVFQWVDDKGNLHFSDSPPETGRAYEIRTFPPPPKTAPGASPTDAPAVATPAESGPTRAPAHLVLRDQLSVDQRNGSVVFTGRVENEGSDTAYDISIAITVTNTDSGKACLAETIEVSPSTLHAGETAGYSKVFYSGCFQRAHRTELRVLWR